jgi:LPPG:FO 2-phospho-L-lactate transferase
MFGLHVSPDTDIVIYALAGVVNPETGWGIAGDTLNVVEALRRYGYERWFNLGDRDLATCVHRTRLLRAGLPLHEVIAGLVRAWELPVRVLPMANEAVRTRITGPEGELAFQDYMVRLRTDLEVRGVRFDGAERARPAPGVLDAIASAEALILAPSNPFVSIGPILAVPGIRAAIERTSAKRVAISPIIAGEVIKGPAGKMLASLGHEVSALGVARLYRGLVDVMVIDAVDAALVPAVEALGMRCVAVPTMMTDAATKAALARDVLAAARRS